MTLIRRSFPVGALGCNCTIVACPETREAMVIDPGDEAPRILDELRAMGVEAAKIVHTHAHLDHVLGTGEVAKGTRAETFLHADDRFLWDKVDMQAQLFGWRAAAPPPPDHALRGDERLGFGKREAVAMHTPGHTPGSLSLYLEHAGERPILFAGDTLFAGSVGRTDLWGGSFPDLARSIRQRLFSLPDDTIVVPGHGPDTTILAEREDNPFVGKHARP